MRNLLFICIAALLTSSATTVNVVKRKHRGGYYVSVSKNKHKTFTSSSKSVVIVPQIVKAIDSIQEVVLVDSGDESFEADLVSPGAVLEVSNFKEIQAEFSDSFKVHTEKVNDEDHKSPVEGKERKFFSFWKELELWQKILFVLTAILTFPVGIIFFFLFRWISILFSKGGWARFWSLILFVFTTLSLIVIVALLSFSLESTGDINFI